MTSAAEDLALDFAEDEEVDEQQAEDESDEDMRDEEAEALAQSSEALHKPPSQLVDSDLDALLDEISKHSTVDDDAEFQLLAKANNYSTVADNEMAALHTTIRNYYSVRFPQLETLIQNPLQYAKAVAAIGNGPLNNLKENSELRSIMNGSLFLSITTLTATEKIGRDMTDAELQRVQSACARAFKLDRAKTLLIEYVQTCMSRFAPNLTAIVGSLTAAQLINAAGGLRALSLRPPCNLPALGVTKSLQAGLSTNVSMRQQGYLYDTDIIKDVPPDLRRQALRIVSAKVALAARVDDSRTKPDGSDGEWFRDEVERRIDKLKAPPPNNGPKALPAPDDKPSRKRGGRRARKAKEATASTELSKARNRLAFGKEEAEVGFGTGDGTVGLGMIGQGSEGKIRATQIDNRTRAKLGKKNAGWGTQTPAGNVSGMASSFRGFGQGAGLGGASVLQAHGLRSGGGGAGTAGTASSIAFTPVQGLELVDPKAQAELKRKQLAEDDRWFKSGTFTQVGGGMAMPPPKKAKMDGDFKVPALPTRK